MTIKRFIWKAILGLAMLLLLLLALLLFMVSTETGVQLVWSRVEPLLPDTIKISSVEGALWSHIKIHGLAYDDGQQQAKAETVAVYWQILPLLRKKIVIDDIVLQGLAITTSLPASDGKKEEKKKSDNNELLSWLGRISLRHADLGTVKAKLGNASLQLSGTLDETWHIQWSANIPELHELATSVRGKLIADGSVDGPRLQPMIKSHLSLTRFDSGTVKIEAVTGNIHIEPHTENHDGGSLKISGLNIESMRVPDFLLKLTAHWKSGEYKLHLNAIFGSDNQLSVKFTLPSVREDAGLNQSFTASAKVDLNRLEQFNSLFNKIPDVKELSGRLSGVLSAKGKLMHPEITSQLSLHNASVFVPAAKMRLTNVNASARYRTGQRIQINGSFAAGGGTGTVAGSYGIEDPALPLTVNVKANDVLVYNTKEYRVILSPDLNVNYQNNDLQLTGSVKVPLAKITPVDFSSTTTLPDDVIIVNRPKADASTPLNLTMRVQIILGDKVKIHYAGLKASLKGQLEIIGRPGSPMTANGEIGLSRDGTFRAYGRHLSIQRGRLIYAGNLLTNPGIDLRASQTIKQVGFASGGQFDGSGFERAYTGDSKLTVGIDVTGTIDKPKLTLFSIPAGLSQGDILSYLLFGYPQSQASGASSMALLGAASGMMTGGDGNDEGLVQNLQNKLGLDEFSVGSTEYYDQTTNGSQSATTVSVGRNLGHDLSLHYSVGLFEQVQVFSLQYQVNKHIVVQTQASSLETGGDVLYRLESRE